MTNLRPVGRSWASSLPALVAAIGSSCSGGPAPDGIAADLVLLNGNVITVDSSDAIAQAVAIRDDAIVAVGTNRDIARLVGSRTRRIDLGGRTATPGLLDAHAHFAWGGVDRLFVLDLSYPAVASVRDVVTRVSEEIGRRRPGEWIEGRGWDEGKLAERRYLYASDLDSISAMNPVWLTHTMGHYGVANRVALERAGITVGTPDPPGGTIDRSPDGTPTGVLKESAQALVTRLIPEKTPEQVRAGMKELAKAFNAECMTGLKDPGIRGPEWTAYQDVLAEGALTVRVFALWQGGRFLESARELAGRVGPFTKPYGSTGDDHLVSGGIKLYLDGSGGARTAWLYDEWNEHFEGTDTGNFGYPVVDPEELRQRIALFHDAGLHVSVHSIGDRAIDWVVDSYAAALEANPVHGLRHGIIHANIPTDHAIDLMQALQRRHDAAYPEPSATFMWWIGDTYAGNFGPTRARRLNPFRTYLEKGIRWAGGSDYNVTPFAARYGLWASMARQPLLGVYGTTPYGTDESIDIRRALRSYTIWSARQMFLEERIGSIEPGKYADIAVWDRDLYNVPPEEIKDLQCQMTIFDGRIVFERPGGPMVSPAR